MLLVLLVVFGAFSVAVVAQVSTSSGSYASASTPTAVIDLAAGLGMIGAGAVSGLLLQRGSIGVLTSMIGVAWLCADWIAWDGPPMIRSLAMVIAPFLLPFVAHLSRAFPVGRVAGRLSQAGIAVAYGVTVFVSLGWALFRDPFRDRYCWGNCLVNSFLVRPQPGVSRSLTVFWWEFVLAAGLAIGAATVWRLGRASRTARRRLVPVLAPVALVAATQAVHAERILADPAEHPDRQGATIVFFSAAIALVAVAAGVVWVVWRELRTRRSVARLANELGNAPAPGSLRDALARSLGDDTLEIAYWLPGFQMYVDANGQHVDPRAAPTQATTPIVRLGQPVAIVIHDVSLNDSHNLEREIGAASRLAVDNERLRAQALAQLSDLQASRSRVVETSDNARRRLERNLHDGAQQRLLALFYELQRAAVDARAVDARRLVDALASASEKAATALVELRDLAHGIFPVILNEAGLGAALASFIDTAPLRVQLVDLPDRRFPGDAEIAAYVAVTSAVERAVGRRASQIDGTFVMDGRDLVIELVDDSIERTADELVYTRDRIDALGGRLEVDGPMVRAVIPCG